jgi:hypothetical protein
LAGDSFSGESLSLGYCQAAKTFIISALSAISAVKKKDFKLSGDEFTPGFLLL